MLGRLLMDALTTHETIASVARLLRSLDSPRTGTRGRYPTKLKVGASNGYV